MVLADDLVVSGSGTLAFGNPAASRTTATVLTMNGAGGTLVLSGTDSYSGGTTVTAGTLIVTSDTALPRRFELDCRSRAVRSSSIPRWPSPAADDAIVAFSRTMQAVPEPGTLALLVAGLFVGFAASG